MLINETTNELIVPESIAKLSVGMRSINGKYATKGKGYLVTTHIQFIGFYCMLKSMTTSGILYDIGQQMDELKQYTNLAQSTIYQYINKCESLELLTHRNHNVKLVSWQKACDIFEVPCERFIPVQYTLGNKAHQAKYVLSIAEQKSNMAAQSYSLLKKYIQSYYPVDNGAQTQSLINMAANSPDELIKTALAKRNSWLVRYKNGIETCEPENGIENLPAEYFLLENRHIWRGTRGLLKSFGLQADVKDTKRKRTITYFKHQLVKRGLAEIKRENKIYSSVRYRPALNSTMIDGQVVKVGFKDIYEPQFKAVGCWLPDAIIPTEMIGKDQIFKPKTEEQNEKPEARKAA